MLLELRGKNKYFLFTTIHAISDALHLFQNIRFSLKYDFPSSEECLQLF